MRWTTLAAAMVSTAALTLIASSASARVGDTIAPITVIGASDTTLCLRYTDHEMDGEAQYWCNRAIRRSENSIGERAASYLHRGVIMLRAGDNEAAMRDIAEAIRLVPDYGDAHANQGNLMFAQGKYQEAVTAYSKAISLGSSQAEIMYFNRSRALNKLGDSAAAAADLEKAKSVMPVDSPLRDRLSMR